MAASAQAEAVHAATGPPEERSLDQCEEHIFGELDRKKAADKVGHKERVRNGRPALVAPVAGRAPATAGCTPCTEGE